MKSTKSQVNGFTARPPVPVTQRSDEQTLMELSAVDSLTETPALAAAKTIGLAPKKALQLWEVEDPNTVTVCTFRLPSPLVAKLKYLAGTTFGETQTSILISILGPKLEKMLKEKQKVV